MTSIAIMQPYFMPYAGYFRLLQSADLFVIYDCVQFPRRGYVHRNQLLKKSNGEKKWLTLPLIKQPRSTQINQLKFKDDSPTTMQSKLLEFGIHKKSVATDLMLHLLNFEQSPSNYLKNLLVYVCRHLEINTRFILSSELDIKPDLKGQDKIIALVKNLGGTQYINAPNGQKLYDSACFKRQDINLEFLSPFHGEHISILQYFINHDKKTLKQLSQSIKKQSI
ncbi:MAG: WbqC family protein [Enterobacterales bacterium]|nr:WbqC family protein [Enterobacterales bacterium]